MTDKFDESNKEHREIRFLLELGVGVPRLVPMSYMREALLEAGFEVWICKQVCLFVFFTRSLD
jgi:sterol 24-C-methyltransferase